MASRSVPGAAQDLYASLTFSGKPATLWFGQASLKNADGTTVDLPLVEFYQESGNTPVTMEHNPLMVETVLRFEVWAKTLETCTSIVLGILFNGGAVGAGSGFFDGGTLTYAANSFSHRALEFAGPIFPALFEGTLDPRSPDAGRAYRGTFRIKVKAEYVGA